MTEATAPATETLADEATMQELVKLNEQRAATYGLLSRLYRVEVDQPLLDELRSMRFPAKTGNENVDEGYRLLATYLSNTWDNSVTDLAIDYVRVFIGHGIDAFSAAYPFESVYTSEKRLLMQEARDEVLAIYRSAGLDKQDTWKEGEDHIALELEFEQIMATRTVEALRKGGRAADHAEELSRRPSGGMGSHDDLRHEAIRANRLLPGLGVLDGRVPPNRPNVPRRRAGRRLTAQDRKKERWTTSRRKPTPA